jgi:MFS family permease
MALWVFRGLPDHPRDARWLAEADREKLDTALQNEARQRAATGSAPASAAKAFFHPLIWKLCLLYFCTMMGLYGLTFWLPKIIKDLGWTGDLRIGLLSAVPWLVAVVFMLFLGAHSDHKQERRSHAAFAAVVGAIGFAFTGFAHGGAPGLLGLCLVAAGVMGMMAVQWSMPSNLLGGSAAAAGIALVNSFGNLGGFVSPTLIGQITKLTGNQTWGLFTTGAILLFAGILLALSPSLEPRKVPVTGNNR